MRFRLDMMEKFLTERVVQLWKRLSGQWWSQHLWECSKMHWCGPWGHGLVLGECLHLVILEGFSTSYVGSVVFLGLGAPRPPCDGRAAPHQGWLWSC